MTVNEIFYSGTFRHLAAGDARSGPGRLWTTDTGLIPLEQAQAPHQAQTLLSVRDRGTANALALWFSAELAPGICLSVGPGDPPTHGGMTTARCARRCSWCPAWPSAPKSGPPQPGRPVTDGELLAIEHALRRREAQWAQRRLVAEQLHRAHEAVQRQTRTWGLAADTNAASPGPA